MQIRTNSVENQNQVTNIGSSTQEQNAQKAGSKAQKSDNTTSIFAGDLGIGMQNDIITQRKQSAQRRALKIIGDAWNSDRKIDRTLDGYRDKIAQLKAEMNENLDQIDLRDEWKEKLRQEYGVGEDSQEQQDLKLLEKEADVEANTYRRNTKPIYLTDEEKERLAEIHEQGLTEYQERSMKLHGQQNSLKTANDKLQTQIQGYNQAIEATKQERLKSHEMVDAQKRADEVLAEASKEVIGLLIDEAKDHVDDEFEEQVEDAKKKAEEKAEQEKKIEERNEKKEELEARIDEAHARNIEQEEQRREAEERSREDADILEGMTDVGMSGLGATAADVKAEIREMLHKMKLLEEDLKGSVIDDKVED